MTEITARNILRHELIGLNVRVANAKNPTMKGLRGRIVDETRNMLIVVSGERKIRVPKDVATFRVKLGDGTVVEVDGARLVGRPENRLKTKVRRW